MKTWKKLGLAGLAAGILAFAVQPANATCINSLDGTVDNAGDCLFATGGNAGSCLLGISIDNDGAGTPPSDPKKIDCIDGDACDGDGAVNGSCSFRVGACVNLPNPGCVAENVTVADVSKPGLKDANDAIKSPFAVYNRNALLAALDSILPNTGEACTDANIPVKVDLKSKGGTCGPGGTTAGNSCTSDLDCDDYCQPVFKKGKGQVALSVTGASGTASAKFKFSCAPATAAVANGARAFQITDTADLIGGPLAMGRTGDFMIRNGIVRAVIRNTDGRKHSFTLLYGGQLIDADIERTDDSADRDGWQGMTPLVNISSTQATDTVSVEHDGNDPLLRTAVIRSSGPDDLFDTIKPNILVLGAGLSIPESADDVDLPVQLSTDFYLPAGSSSIQIATTVQNTSGSPLTYFMGDYLNAGGQLEPFGPGQGYGETQLRNGSDAATAQTLDYMAFQGGLDSDGVTYGVIFQPNSAGGRNTLKTGTFASSGVFAWTTNVNLFNVLFAPPTSGAKKGGTIIAANGTSTLRRWFVIGKTVADVTKARTELFQQPKAVLQGTVTVGNVPSAGAHVTLLNSNIVNKSICDDSDPSLESCQNVFSSTLSDENGFYRFVVPAGDYRLTARKAGAPYPGNSSSPTKTPVTLAEKKTVVQDVVLPSTGTIVVNSEDQSGNPIAAKVSIVGIPASPDPLSDQWLLPAPASLKFTGRYFGFNFEEKGDVFGLVDARFTGINGTTGAFNLEPGNYHVVVSHGYEFDVYDEVITVTAGGTTTVDATVNRVVDTTGFVSIDTHVHMINSPDSTISRERRILTMIAEGVEFFVNTDHDFVHSLTDDIADMGAGGLVGNAPSVETTTSHYGHFNTWPITVDDARIDGGAIDWSAHNGLGSGYPSGGRYDSLPSEIFAAAAAYPDSQVIQINHFNSGTLGHFNMLGINTAEDPPTSSNNVYRCVGGTNVGLPCKVSICVGGADDGDTCSGPGDCTGGSCAAQSNSCSGGGTCTLSSQNLGSYLRLDPTVANLYSDDYTALEVWIEAGRAQTDLLRADNMGDWFNLLNQGRFKAGTADSDTHSSISVQAGGPRTFVASSTDAPGSIDAQEIATNVNGLRAVGSNGPFMRVELENGSSATASQAVGSSRTVAFTGGGADKVNLHIEAPTWAEYDTIEIYMNSSPSCHSAWTFFGVINPTECNTVTPTHTLTKGVDFAVSTSTGVSGFGTRQVTDVSYPVTITADTWVVVVVRGTDSISHPMFPMLPQDLEVGSNSTLADLTDNGGPLPWNLGEQGALALAFSNPLFFDDGDDECMNGTPCPGL